MRFRVGIFSGFHEEGVAGFRTILVGGSLFRFVVGFSHTRNAILSGCNQFYGGFRYWGTLISTLNNGTRIIKTPK